METCLSPLAFYLTSCPSAHSRLNFIIEELHPKYSTVIYTMMEFPRKRSPVSTQIMPQQWHNTINTFEDPRCKIKQSIPINKLPTEILLLILEMLHISDINSMTRVNHCWNAHAIPVLYKTTIIGCYGTNAADSEAAVRNFNSVTFCNE